MSKELKFDCPQCHGTRITEVMSDAIVETAVRSVDSDGQLDYGDALPTDYEGDLRYVCSDCGATLCDDEGDIDEAVRLADWLKKQECNQ